MHPILFEIGTFKVHTFGLMLVVGFFAGLWLVRKLATERRLNVVAISDGCFWSLIVGILGARLVFIAQEWSTYAANPSKLLTLQFEGLTSFGGFVFGGLFMAWWLKRAKVPMLAAMDVLGPGLALAYAIGRVGCFLNGCCAGGACPPGFPLGVIFPGTDVLVHPAQLYETAMTLAGLGLLLFLMKSGKLATGQALGVFLVLHGVSRYIYEAFRAGATSTYWGSLPITEAQAFSALIAAAGVIVFLETGRRAKAKLANDGPQEPKA